jgi:hypothetical protein
MARGTITEHALSRLSGTAITYVTANSTDNHAFDNSGGKKALLIKNGSASPFTATIVTPATVDGMAIPDLAVTVAAGATAIVGPFPDGTYNQSDDTVNVDASATSADVKLAIIDY